MIQNYVDRDPGPGAYDLACGHLTYNGHKGTDFRLLDLRQMRHGVRVLAAAAGRVTGVRNDMVDVNVRRIGRAALAGRECGNGVLIDHGNGWTTQYCHMKRGSVRVRPGRHVRAGEVLGEVGLSGLTEFPHLHLSLAHDRRPVDPFVGPEMRSGCGRRGRSMWRDAAARGLVYRPTGVISAGFSNGEPTRAEVEEGVFSAETLDRRSAALVFLVRYFGVRKGDLARLRVIRPDGGVLTAPPADASRRSQAYAYRFAGRRRPKSGAWPVGDYVGQFSLVRDGRTIATARRSVRVR